MFQLPVVTDILQKRRDYETAKEAFLGQLLGNGKIYEVSRDELNTWLAWSVMDPALCEEIQQCVAAGKPVLHWGDGDDVPACGAENIPFWQQHTRYSEAISCPGCRSARAEVRADADIAL